MKNKYPRVLIFTSSRNPIIIKEHEELQKHLDTVILSGLFHRGPLIKEILKNLPTLALKIKHVISLRKFISENRSFFSNRKLINYYLHLLHLLILDSKFNFDIIHAHFIYPTGLLATFFSKYFKKRIIITARGYDADERTFNDSSLTDIVIKTCSQAEKILTAEKRLYNNLLEHGINNISLTNNFVELTDLEYSKSDIRRNLKIDSNAFIIVFGPHLKNLYGAEDFAKAILIIHDKIPELFVVCIGDGDMKNYLRESFEKHNIKFRFTGKIPNSGVTEFLKACDIVCNLGYAGQGIFTLEAWSCAKPVIGYANVGEVKIEDKITGLLTEKGNVKKISELILQMYEDLNLRKKLGLNGRKKLEVNYSKEKRISKILSLYND